MTGGTGFLGSYLLIRLIQENYRVILLKRSSSSTWRIQAWLDRIRALNIDETNLEGIFQRDPIHAVIHCATNYGRTSLDPLAILQSNLILPLTLLETARKYRPACFINTDTMLGKEVSRYSLSKSQFKEWLKMYSRDLKCINVSVEHFYGPMDDESKFVTYLIKNMTRKVPCLDLTPGEQKRDFIYIEDVIEAFLRILAHSEALGNGFYPYEVGTNQTVEIRKLAELVKKLSGNHETLLNFGALPYRENEIMESRVDTSEIRKLGWHPKVSLEEGLRRTIAMEKQ